MKHNTHTPTAQSRKASIAALIIGVAALIVSIILALTESGDASTWSIAFSGIVLLGIAGIQLLNDSPRLG